MVIISSFGPGGRLSSGLLPSGDEAIQTASWLRRLFPHRARAFALAMHERAAWDYNDRRTEHWSRVLRLLPKN